MSPVPLEICKHEPDVTGSNGMAADVTVRPSRGGAVGRRPHRCDPPNRRRCHQHGGWTHPRTDQPKVLANRETPLHGWRTGHIAPTPRVSSPLSLSAVLMEVEGSLVVGSAAIVSESVRDSRPRLHRTVTGGRKRRGDTYAMWLDRCDEDADRSVSARLYVPGWVVTRDTVGSLPHRVDPLVRAGSDVLPRP